MICDKKIISAPIQGWTDHVWREAHAQVFGGIDEYYAPFMRVEHGSIRARDLRDIQPDNNTGIHLVPQVLACRSDDMRQMLTHVIDFGYSEVSINLGCPHPPIARKGYGSGMLARPEALNQIFELLDDFPLLHISLKLRLGWDDPEQWRVLLPLVEDSRINHVVVHYRIGTQQYKGDALTDHIGETLEAFNCPVVINGDIDSIERIEQLLTTYPAAAGFMVGRALVAAPALLCPDKATTENYQLFHDLIYNQYQRELTGGDHQVLHKMQALWERMLPNADHRARKAIRKANNLARYEEAVRELIMKVESEDS